jgi:peptidoglycan-N-acetylglucosamine deacetylase
VSGSPFVLSVDFEDWHQLVLRRIGRADWFDGGPTFPGHVARVLELLDELGLRATFFVAGIAAERHPGALREVVSAGHEIGCHGYDHRRIFQLTPDAFRSDVARCVDVVEEICGVRPRGYRAPWFSINRDCAWAHDVLVDLGFRYSSSVYDSPRLPRRFEAIPAAPFVVRDALWEFPVAAWRLGPTSLPLGGGAYWRALPGPVLRRGLEHLARTATLPVLYFHPYEFAPERLRVALPRDARARERLREAARSAYKNMRRDLIAVRLREAAASFGFVTFSDVLADPTHPPLLRPAHALV